MLAAVHLWLA